MSNSKYIFTFLVFLFVNFSCSKKNAESNEVEIVGFNSQGIQVRGLGFGEGSTQSCPETNSALAKECKAGDYKILFLKDCTELCSQPVAVPSQDTTSQK